MNKEESSCFVYILKCSDGTYYTGWTNNLEKRLDTHNAGLGAKYTRARIPVELVYSEQCPNKSIALQKERAIKKMSRSQKILLIHK